MDSSDEQSQNQQTCVAINIVKKANQRQIGGAVYKRLNRSGMTDVTTCSITLYEFMDNEQFSVLDSFLIHIGGCILYLSDEMEDSSKGDGRKISNLLYGKDIESVFMKKSCFTHKDDLNANILKLVGKATHITNAAETEKPLAFACIECLVKSLRLLRTESSSDVIGCLDLRFGSLNNMMRLDSAAADAVNLLPKPDHPSQFGSIYGVLNRCKTKSGSRLLERWLRQPLLDADEINARLDIVEILKSSTVSRNQLTEGPLKAAPDLEAIIAKMQRKNAGLEEIFKLYVFTRSLPNLASILSDLAAGNGNGDDQADGDADENSGKMGASIKNKFVVPLQALVEKFQMYQQLVEHVIDLDQLPELMVSPLHDPNLQELREEQDDLEKQANQLYHHAKDNWASFADLKLEKNVQHGMIFRTTKSDDERQLRQNNKDITILSLQKNGVHFTTSKLSSIGDRLKDIDIEYKQLQKDLVGKSVDTALTYLPIAEAASAIVAEVDVLTAFATAAAIAPGEYVRPKILPQGSGIIHIKAARHPCVELMDNVEFIANDYNFVRNESSFQIITGPNMGGKSTYIRGIGSIVVMAQCGSYVPCEYAEISIIDCILARVGAGDAVQKGVSTFMAEMLEASVILQTATKDSLIIIDELGRGTSTFDGFGLAWAISEYMVKNTDCMCLFATHFHELTALSNKHPCVVNKHVNAIIDQGNVVMIYSVQDGPCKESFGIHVATMANFPKEVIMEAKRKANELEGITDDGEMNNGNGDAADDDVSHTKQRQKLVESSMQTFSEMKDMKSTNAEKLHEDIKPIFPSSSSSS